MPPEVPLWLFWEKTIGEGVGQAGRGVGYTTSGQRPAGDSGGARYKLPHRQPLLPGVYGSRARKRTGNHQRPAQKLDSDQTGWGGRGRSRGDSRQPASPVLLGTGSQKQEKDRTGSSGVGKVIQETTRGIG